MLVLEPLEAARARGVTVYCELAGFGMSSDAHHITQPSTDGAARAMPLALTNSGLDREAIGVLQFEYNWRWIPFGHTLKEVFDFLAGRPYLLGRLTADGVEYYADWHPEPDPRIASRAERFEHA